jgi:hypothetical protein
LVLYCFNKGPDNPFFGKKHTKETREKISKALKGKYVGEKNHRYGVKLSEETRKKQSVHMISEKNPMWKGEDAGYHAVHYWVRARLPKPESCARCRQSKTLELCNISGDYLRVLDDWEYLCRRCHMVSDGRMYNNLVKSRKVNQ